MWNRCRKSTLTGVSTLERLAFPCRLSRLHYLQIPVVYRSMVIVIKIIMFPNSNFEKYFVLLVMIVVINKEHTCRSYVIDEAYLIAMLLALRWCQRWFISSRRLCSITASSWDARLLRSFLPVPLREANTSLWLSISDCRSWNKYFLSNKRHFFNLKNCTPWQKLFNFNSSINMIWYS